MYIYIYIHITYTYIGAIRLASRELSGHDSPMPHWRSQNLHGRSPQVEEFEGALAGGISPNINKNWRQPGGEDAANNTTELNSHSTHRATPRAHGANARRPRGRAPTHMYDFVYDIVMLCVYIYIYTYVYVCMYVCVYIYIYIYMCTYTYIHIHIYIYTCIWIHIHIYIYIYREREIDR